MESLIIDLEVTGVDIYSSCDKSIYLCIGYENTSEEVEISRETLKSYIDKLQLIYDSTK